MEVNVGNIWKVQDVQSPVRADKVIFLACMITCCVFGFFFHKFCNLRKCSPLTRHAISFFVGYLIAFFCYGIRSGHLIAMASTVYLVLHIFSPKRAFWTSFLFCITYSSWAHLYRMKFDYGGYSADVSLIGDPMLSTLTGRIAVMMTGVPPHNEYGWDLSTQ
ncbi:Membrane-bound O-acyltransferase domain-containing protein 2 [Taenia solium]|eukprot:TsM_000417200 transcript=TsM_000417200 gene=TsM_000417200